MFKNLVQVLFLVASATTAFAGGPISLPVTTTTTKNNPSLFLGFVMNFGGAEGGTATPGLTLKVLSTNKRKALAASAGVTYYFDGTFGCDLGLGYNTSGASMTLGYDICKPGVQFGLGATTKPKTVTTTTLGEGGPS